MDNEFADIKTSIAANASALEEIEKAISAPPPPAPPSQGGSEVHPGLRPTPGGRGMSFSEAVGAHGPQSVVNDVTTPTFNRKTNPTKLFCNLHDRAKVPKHILQQRFQLWLLRQVLRILVLLFWVMHWITDLSCNFQGMVGRLRSMPCNSVNLYSWVGCSRRTKHWLMTKTKRLSFMLPPDENPC